MGIKKWYGKVCFIISVFIAFILSTSILYAEDYTLADVVDIQNKNESYIQTMHAVVESDHEFNGKRQLLSFEYGVQRDADGNKKVMVHSLGKFESQFMVDTKEKAVYTLMADGSVKKKVLTQEQLDSVGKIAGIKGIFGSDAKSYYAGLMNAGNTATDAIHGDNFDVKEFENSKVKINVSKEFWGNRAVVEYTDKDAQLLEQKLDEKLIKLNDGKAETKGGKLLKDRAINKIKMNKSVMLMFNPTKRIEKINMKNGVVEDQEWFNDKGKRIMRTKIVNTVKKRVKVHKGNKPVSGIKAVSETASAQEEEIEIEVPSESETESETVAGRAFSRTKWNDVSVNQPVDFKWIDLKKRSEINHNEKNSLNNVQNKEIKVMEFDKEKKKWKEK